MGAAGRSTKGFQMGALSDLSAKLTKTKNLVSGNGELLVGPKRQKYYDTSSVGMARFLACETARGLAFLATVNSKLRQTSPLPMARSKDSAPPS
ncbi:hypothetical protein L1987_60511 [Smallanthus sonchifolius]|uniref:Uncharacterized protein n=1 Tax=Smallanthus sonchifolius TaxID=185202 RepID=A0ACB9D8E2_9ASTR|nr:hypothetical protein L1987_60511 [Smallanthus sonchifolius]